MAKDIKLVICVDETSEDIESKLFYYLNTGYTIITTKLETRCDRASGVFILEKEIENVPRYIELLEDDNKKSLALIEEYTKKDADWYDKSIEYLKKRIEDNEIKAKILRTGRGDM